jgi:hypothetical protein
MSQNTQSKETQNSQPNEAVVIQTIQPNENVVKSGETKKADCTSCRVEIPAEVGVKSWSEHPLFKEWIEGFRKQEGRDPDWMELQEMEAYTMMAVLYK